MTFSSWAEEKDLLLTNYSNLAEERDRLHQKLDDLSENESKAIITV